MASRKAPIKGRPAHFPAGLGLIAAYLKAEGYSVDVLDNEVECLNKDNLSNFIKKSKCDIFGITAMAPQYSYVKGLSRMIKELKNKPVILGGPLATYSHEAVLKNTDVDVCVVGEGEETIIDLLKNMSNPENVAGIAYRENSDIKVTSARKFKYSRDDYPFPAYELFNMDPYFKKQQVHYEGWGSNILNKKLDGLKNIGIVAGIGCPYHCKFCSRSVTNSRLRSVDNIISEIKYLISKYNIDGVRFIDELLLINRKRTLELCEKIKLLNIIWSGQARSNTLDDEIASVLKEAGCVGIGLGIETGSEGLLKAMNKQVTVENHRRAIKAAKNNNLAVQVQIMYGYPGENKDTIEETISFFKEVQLPQRRFNILTPLPGSEVYRDCLDKKIITDENKYLEEVSANEAGFAYKKALLNLTTMTNKEFEDLLLYAGRTMEDNYKKMFKETNRLWFFQIIKDIILRQFRRAKKIISLTAWKNKIESIIKKQSKLSFSKKQIEDLYFKL